MDELLLLRVDADRTSLPHDDRLAPARARLMAAIDAETAARPAPPAGRRAQRPMWLRWPVVSLAGGLAAAAMAVALINPLPPPAPQDQFPPAMVPVGQVLQNAARASLRHKDVVPRPNQFLYTKDTGNGVTTESWLSVDGTHDGLIKNIDGTGTERIPGCRDGKRQAYVQDKPLPGTFDSCEPDPAYDPGIPTDTDAMIAYLHQRNPGHSDPESQANAMAKMVWETSYSTYLSPAQRAALFRAAVTIPGLRAVQVADAKGRPGIGVTWSFKGGPASIMIFDPKSYEYVGTPDSTEEVSRIVDHVGDRS